MPDEQARILFSGLLGIDYGQFYVDVVNDRDDEDDYLDMDGSFEAQNNGLCGASMKGKLFLLVGIQGGIIDIKVELHDVAPPTEESFEDIVECSIEVGSKPISLCEWACEATHPLDLPAASYRVRYSISGIDRDYGDDDDWEAPVPQQRFLLQFWPSEMKPDEIVRADSEMGRYWHSEFGKGV